MPGCRSTWLAFLRIKLSTIYRATGVWSLFWNSFYRVWSLFRSTCCWVSFAGLPERGNNSWDNPRSCPLRPARSLYGCYSRDLAGNSWYKLMTTTTTTMTTAVTVRHTTIRRRAGLFAVPPHHQQAEAIRGRNRRANPQRLRGTKRAGRAAAAAAAVHQTRGACFLRTRVAD